MLQDPGIWILTMGADSCGENKHYFDKLFTCRKLFSLTGTYHSHAKYNAFGATLKKIYINIFLPKVSSLMRTDQGVSPTAHCVTCI